MANVTGVVCDKVEPYVRRWLADRYGAKFSPKDVFMPTGQKHVLDAVSANGRIVANIVSNRSRTRGDKPNTGGRRKAENDFWRLANLQRQGVRSRLLVFTDEAFMRDMAAILVDPSKMAVELVYCPLSPTLRRELKKTLDEASVEQTSRVDRGGSTSRVDRGGSTSRVDRAGSTS